MNYLSGNYYILGLEKIVGVSVHDQIQELINGHDVVLFMKGDADMPLCGFSAAVVQVLSHLGVRFHGENVLADEEIRQGIKEFSDWPTIPQLYVKGEFIGGCDIVREMYMSGELKTLFDEKGISTNVTDAA